MFLVITILATPGQLLIMDTHAPFGHMIGDDAGQLDTTLDSGVGWAVGAVGAVGLVGCGCGVGFVGVTMIVVICDAGQKKLACWHEPSLHSTKPVLQLTVTRQRFAGFALRAVLGYWAHDPSAHRTGVATGQPSVERQLVALSQEPVLPHMVLVHGVVLVLQMLKFATHS